MDWRTTLQSGTPVAKWRVGSATTANYRHHVKAIISTSSNKSSSLESSVALLT